MNESVTVCCPKNHGPLARLTPATFDGVQVEIGGCWKCGGLWVPVDVVQHLFPEEQRVRFAETGFTDVGPGCGRCPDSPAMRSQRVQGIEIDRCFECLCLWLDGGELWLLGGGDQSAVQDRGLCDVCGQSRDSASRSRTALGWVCGRCRSQQPLRVGAAVVHTLGLGGDSGDGIHRREVDGAVVESMYDAAPGTPTLFQWRGPLADSSVRGTVGYETRLSNVLRTVGIRDIEVGDPTFDARFKVTSAGDEAMLGWLSSQVIRDDLMALADIGGCVVLVDRDGMSILGELSPESEMPLPVLEDACERVYLSLRSVG